MKRSARILLADDHELYIETLRDFLEERFEIVSIVRDGQSLLTAAADSSPDVVVADIGMPVLNGIEAGRKLKDRQPSVKLIYLTQHRDPALAIKAFQVGASAFVVKSYAASELIPAIDEALADRSYVSSVILSRVVETLFLDGEREVSKARLIGRQCEVCRLLAKGRPLNELAGALKVLARTP